MRPFVRRSLLVLALCLPAAGWSMDGWAQLKPGMNRSETTAVLGRELIASKGRGFEVAIYDSRAEVFFLNGQLVAWTAPASSSVAGPSPQGTWQFDQAPRPAAQRQARRTLEPGAARAQRNAVLPSYRW